MVDTSAPPGAPRPGTVSALAGPRRVGAGFALATVGGAVSAAAVGWGGPILATRWSLLARIALWAVFWVVGVAAAMRLPSRVALPAILAAALVLRLAVLAGPPTLSDDLYRYSWDGRVQSAGIEAYRYPPDAPQLAHLRESWLWPGPAGCAELDRSTGCTRINRPHVRTAYPPVAQAWFFGVYQVAGIDARHKAWQVAGLATEMALVGLLMVALRAWGRDPRWAALYALSPFPVIEVVGDGHVDGLAALAVVAALAWAGRHRSRGHAVVGALIGAAALVKLYPAALLAAFVAQCPRRGWPRWLPPVPTMVGFAGVAVAAYLPHVLAVGGNVVGYLPGYLEEERFDDGGRFLLLGLAGVPAGLRTAFAVVIVVALVVVVLARRAPAPDGCCLLFGGLLIVATPVQPWYAVTLLAVASVAGRPRWALVAAAGYPYFFAVILDHPQAQLIGQLSYGLALLGVVAAGTRAWWSRPTEPAGGPALEALPGTLRATAGEEDGLSVPG